MYTFPPFIDSTMLATYRLCEAQWVWRFLEHLVPATPSIDLNAGGAFAKGLEIARRAFYEGGKSQEDSVALGLEALTRAYGAPPIEGGPKSWEGVARALIGYSDHYPFATDHLQPFIHEGRATVEFSAAIPLPIPHPVTGDPLLFSGRFDMLASHTQLEKGQAFCVDEKTTGRIDTGWAAKWQVRGQFIAYNWLARERGYAVAGTIVRGIVIHKDDCQFVEVPILTPAWKIKEWYEGMLLTAERMIASWRAIASRRPIKALNDACAMYSGCAYMRLCDSSRPEMWLSPYYERREWNPIEKGVHVPTNHTEKL